MKFSHGGWVTLLITSLFVALCLWVKSHYRATNLALKRLDDMLVGLDLPAVPVDVQAPDPNGPTAVLLVNGYSGLGIHAIFSMRKLFNQQGFKNAIFLQVGRIDSSKFKGLEEIGHLRESIEDGLKRYVELAQRMGYCSEYRLALGTDVPMEVDRLCQRVADDFVEPVFFAGKLIFANETTVTRFLHNQTSIDIQRRLIFQGHNMIVLPIRVL
jgi:hypothetical protein